jgi:hypothetical protein
VRTGGRYAGARGGGDRSWLLIKHRDDWAGDLDITEFAPRSVKSDGDFEDILGEDTPAVWHTNRPAKGGDAGAMLAKIIDRAAALKSGRSTTDTRSARTQDTTRSARTEDTKVTKDTKEEKTATPKRKTPSAPGPQKKKKKK